MNFIQKYDLKVRGYVKVGPAKFDIDFDIKDFVNSKNEQNLINIIKEKIDKENNLKGKVDVKYNVTISGFMDCFDVLKHGDVRIVFNNDDING